jgi:hypothetical protein
MVNLQDIESAYERANDLSLTEDQIMALMGLPVSLIGKVINIEQGDQYFEIEQMNGSTHYGHFEFHEQFLTLDKSYSNDSYVEVLGYCYLDNCGGVDGFRSIIRIEPFDMKKYQ